MDTPDKTRAREYLRVSHDRSGRERSITEQQADNRARWPDLDFNGAAYSDVSISASRYTDKVRGGFAELSADLAAGRFGADVLVLWEASRGSRRVGEWVTLVELCEDQGVRVAVTTDSRVYDPANPRDRRSLLEDAVDAEYESAKLSARAKRAAAGGAAEGRPHGRVPYGYRRRYDPATGRLAAQEIEPAEADVVREMFDRITRGHSLRSIARDLEARGVRNRSGRPFSPAHVRSLVTGDLYRGKRVHVPGRKGGRTDLAGAAVTLVDATWPAIVPERTFLAVQRILTDPARRTSRPGRARHLLSMIARCDVCAGPLAATSRRAEPEYQCHRSGHIRVRKAALDDLAERVILGYLARPDNVDRLTATGDDGAALEAAETEVARIRAELDDLADQVGRGDLSATLAARAEPAIVARLRTAEAHKAELSTPSVLRGLITPGADVARRWRDAPMSTRREVARLLLVPELLGELRVTRAPTTGRYQCPVQDRVVWRTEP